MNSQLNIIYRIDVSDRISFVNKYYDEFAEANDGQEVASNRVLNRPLWDFITDPTTQQIYRDIIGRVRGGRDVEFTFRCDSPDCRKLLKMEVTQSQNDEVQFVISEVSAEERPSQRLIDPNVTRSDEILRICGWCKKVDINGEWIEIEEAMEMLCLVDQQKLPMLTHGICEHCYSKMVESLAEDQ